MTSAVFRALRVGLLTAMVAALAVDANAAEGVAPAPAPAPAPSAGESGGGPHYFSNSATYSDGGRAVKTVTRSAEAAIGQCSQDDPICIADALDAYAAALRNLSPPLPPDLQALPDIVSHAAHQVRQARTRAQATRAIKIAIAEVHKTIALLKADDPIVLKVETRQGAFVAETLAVAENKLEKASGL
jgi:hypothetical protein